MNEEKQEALDEGTTELLSRISPVVLISVAVGVTLITLLAIIALVLSLSLSRDVSYLEDQTRKLNKAVKTMEQDLGEMRSTLAERAPVAAKPAPTPVLPTHMDTADPANDCVIRSGSKDGLAGCLK